jgi:hypothetical protein
MIAVVRPSQGKRKVDSKEMVLVGLQHICQHAGLVACIISSLWSFCTASEDIQGSVWLNSSEVALGGDVLEEPREHQPLCAKTSRLILWG